MCRQSGAHQPTLVGIAPAGGSVSLGIRGERAHGARARRRGRAASLAPHADSGVRHRSQDGSLTTVVRRPTEQYTAVLLGVAPVISTVGAIFALLVVVGLIFRPSILPWCLSAAVCLSGSAAIVIAGQNVQAFYIVAIAILGATVTHLRLKPVLAADLTSKPGMRPLTAFATWSLMVTATAPFIFAGTSVINPRDGIDDGIAYPASLAYQISNFAQSGYLFFGVAIVIVLGTKHAVSPWVPASGLAIGTVLSSVRYIMPESLAVSLFDSSPNVFISGEVERMRGIFPEPSALGGFEVTAAVFFVMAASRTAGWRRYASLGLGLWALTNAVLSGSGTALMGGLLILGVIGAQAVYRAMAGRSRISVGAIAASLLALPLLVVVGPSLYAGANGLVGDKVGGSSYANRNAADAFSFQIAGNTYGVGVGVGANRPSSFVAMLLSTTGVLGTALFVAAFAGLLWSTLRSHAHQPTAWGLVALICSKVVAGPDLSDPLMWFLLAVCANGAWNRSAAVPAAEPRTGPVALLDLPNERPTGMVTA